MQVLELCPKAGLVKLGHVSLDGTKVKANASKHKAMSYARMKEQEPLLAAEVARWLKQAEVVDAAEDAQFGAERRGDEMPEWVANKQRRLAKIREAKAALEAEARATAQAERDQDQHSDRDSGGPPPAAPADEAQRNFTDPDSSRIMKSCAEGFVQAYNGQAAVDAHRHVIVAQMLITNPQTSATLADTEPDQDAPPGAKQKNYRPTPDIVQSKIWPNSTAVTSTLTSPLVARFTAKRMPQPAARPKGRAGRRCGASFVRAAGEAATGCVNVCLSRSSE